MRLRHAMRSAWKSATHVYYPVAAQGKLGSALAIKHAGK